MPPENIEITFVQPDGTRQTVHASPNTSIMHAALSRKIEGIEGVCDGCVACATCHVYIPPEWQSRVTAQDNEQSEEEADMLDMTTHRKDASRLGCQIKLTQALNGLTIHLPDL